MLYSQKLRLLASWLEDHPDIDERESTYWNYPSIWISAGEDATEFGNLCRSMGEFEKRRSSWSDSIEAVHAPETDNDRIFRVTIALTGACQKVPVLDENGSPVTRKVTREVAVETREEVTEEPEYEWKCPDSWLNL